GWPPRGRCSAIARNCSARTGIDKPGFVEGNAGSAGGDGGMKRNGLDATNVRRWPRYPAYAASGTLWLGSIPRDACRAGSAQYYAVATRSKLGDAFSRSDLREFDALVVDESYQADSAKYYAVGGLAPVHLLVGDSGQISPFTTIDDPCRWRGLPEDPLQTAVGVLRRNHPGTAVYGLPITRRLDARAVRVAQLFYPDLSFAPAVLPGAPELP